MGQVSDKRFSAINVILYVIKFLNVKFAYLFLKVDLIHSTTVVSHVKYTGGNYFLQLLTVSAYSTFSARIYINDIHR